MLKDKKTIVNELLESSSNETTRLEIMEAYWNKQYLAGKSQLAQRELSGIQAQIRQFKDLIKFLESQSK